MEISLLYKFYIFFTFNLTFKKKPGCRAGPGQCGILRAPTQSRTGVAAGVMRLAQEGWRPGRQWH